MKTQAISDEVKIGCHAGGLGNGNNVISRSEEEIWRLIIDGVSSILYFYTY